LLVEVELEALALVILHVGTVGLLVHVASAEVTTSALVENTMGVLIAILRQLINSHGPFLYK
jgi:hypothetical protein